MIHVLSGISGSGKSTLAKQLAASDPNSIILSRDKFRELLFGFNESEHPAHYSSPGLREREETVTKFFNGAVKQALRADITVIADNTHLSDKYLDAYKKFAVPVCYHFVNEPLDTCLSRDAGRTRQVGASVINKQWEQFSKIDQSIFTSWSPRPFEGVNDPTNPWTFIFDIDGTLAHAIDRSPYDYSRVKEDGVDSSLKMLTRYMQSYQFNPNHEEISITLCTGRDAACIEDTKEWLHDNNVNYDSIHIRPLGDHRPDWEVKQEMWESICKKNYIAGMFDDRDQVVDHARRLGFNVYQVAYGDF